MGGAAYKNRSAATESDIVLIPSELMFMAGATCSFVQRYVWKNLVGGHNFPFPQNSTSDLVLKWELHTRLKVPSFFVCKNVFQTESE